MSVLILGAEGIAGSALMRAIPDARGTTRRSSPADSRIIPNVDITSRGDLEMALAHVDPDVVVNCAGVVQSECGSRASDCVCAVNAEAPHMLAEMTARSGCRVVHLSTDGVFDGARGGRTEAELPDANDPYGKSKASGELATYDHCLTIRTSFIGLDPMRGRGLLEWLLAQEGEITGYANMLWSGLSADELARVIAAYAIPSALSGLYHVSGPVISKADLLAELICAMDLPVHVRHVNEPRIDRTLDGSKFHQATGYVAPSWSWMAQELAHGTAKASA